MDSVKVYFFMIVKIWLNVLDNMNIYHCLNEVSMNYSLSTQWNLDRN